MLFLALGPLLTAAPYRAQATNPTEPIRPLATQQEAERSVEGRSQPFDLICEVDGKQPCEFKVCEGSSCTVSAFDGQRFVVVGKIDNLDYLIEQMKK